MPKLGEAFVVIRAAMEPLKAGLAAAKSAVTKAMATITNTIKQAIHISYKYIKRAMLVIVGAIGYAVYAFGGFESAMRKATAVSDVSMAQFNKMSKMAREEAIRLNMDAKEAASAFYFLGSAGLSVKQQLEAFVPTLTLAKAGVSAIGSTAENLVDIMKGFDLPFSRAGYVTDVLAKAATTANATLAQFTDSLKEVSGLGRKTHNTLEQMTAAIAAMAGVGFKGSRAGFMLRRVLMRLMDPANIARKKADELGVAIYDTTGKMRPFIDIVGDITKVLKGATEEQRNAAFSALFGQRAIAGQIAIFDKGKKALQEYAQSLKDSGGTAQEIADKQLNSLSEQFGRLRKVISDIAKVLGSSLAPALRFLVKEAIDKTTEWRDAIEKHKFTIMKWSLIFAARINFVRKIVFDFTKFLITDWPSAWRFVKDVGLAEIKVFWESFKKLSISSLKVTIEQFKAIGKSLIIVFEKIFDSIASNLGVWWKRSRAKSKAFKDEYSKALKELKAEQKTIVDFPKTTKGGLMPLHGPTIRKTIDEETKKAAKAIAEKRVRERALAGEFTVKFPGVELGETWKDVGDKIKNAWKPAIDYAKSELVNIGKEIAELQKKAFTGIDIPKQLKDSYEKHLKDLQEREKEIIETINKLKRESAKAVEEAIGVRKPTMGEAGIGEAVETGEGRIGFAGFKEAWNRMAGSMSVVKKQVSAITENTKAVIDNTKAMYSKVPVNIPEDVYSTKLNFPKISMPSPESTDVKSVYSKETNRGIKELVKEAKKQTQLLKELDDIGGMTA